jgi:ComF family protein
VPIIPLAKTAANALVSALLAPCCAICNAILETPLEGCVCGNCWSSVHLITPPLCDMCGDPLPLLPQYPGPQSSDRPELCGACTLHPRVIVRARAIGEYDTALRDIIHALKYEGRYSVAKGLGELMRSAGERLLQEADCVVPVPLHPRRERARGFNQAHELAQRLGRPLLDALVRPSYTVPQIELPAHQRHANVRGAFRLRRTAFGGTVQVKGLRMVIVDDVSTTGSTLDACAAVLKDAGALHVYALTAARVPSSFHNSASGRSRALNLN